MSMDELMSLEIPADDNAHLYLWTTNAFMVEAHELAEAWGFRQVTICTWTKTHQKDPSKVSMKTGYYYRGATEHFLFCVRGSLKLQTTEALPTGYLWPRTPHSVKPEAFYDLVEKASPGPYLELFARRNRLGWATWGDQSLVHEEIA
jgi:N6-adenosine-specific RNA methylase IME4